MRTLLFGGVITITEFHFGFDKGDLRVRHETDVSGRQTHRSGTQGEVPNGK